MEHLGLGVTARAGADESGRPHRWQRIDSYILAFVSIFSLLTVSLVGHHYSTLSPIDELQHIDYAIKISKFDLVRQNELVGQEALHEAACRGVDAPGYVSPPCDVSITQDASGFQERGVNTAASSNPPYYFISGVFGRLVVAVTPLDSLVRGIRLSGALWMSLAFASVWVLLGELGISRSQRAVAVGLVSATPLLVFGFSTVNPDNAILPISAAVIIGILRFERRALPWWAAVLIPLAAMVTEATSVLAVLAGGTYLLLRSVQPGALERKPAFFGLGLVAGAVPGAMLITKIHQRVITGLPNLDFDLPRDALFAADPGYVTINLLVRRLGALVNPIAQPYIPVLLRGQITTTLLYFTGILLMGTGLAAILTSPRRSPVGLLCTAAAAWLLVAGPLFTIRWSDSTLPIPARYGLPLLPIMLAGTASVAYKRSAKLSLGAFALFGNGYLLFRLLDAFS